MELKIKIELDNVAFFNDFETELQQCFDEILDCIGNGQKTGPIHDSNGNTIGRFSINSQIFRRHQFGAFDKL